MKNYFTIKIDTDSQHNVDVNYLIKLFSLIKKDILIIFDDHITRNLTELKQKDIIINATPPKRGSFEIEMHLGVSGLDLSNDINSVIKTFTSTLELAEKGNIDEIRNMVPNRFPDIINAFNEITPYKNIPRTTIFSQNKTIYVTKNMIDNVIDYEANKTNEFLCTIIGKVIGITRDKKNESLANLVLDNGRNKVKIPIEYQDGLLQYLKNCNIVSITTKVLVTKHSKLKFGDITFTSVQEIRGNNNIKLDKMYIGKRIIQFNKPIFVEVYKSKNNLWEISNNYLNIKETSDSIYSALNNFKDHITMIVMDFIYEDSAKLSYSGMNLKNEMQGKMRLIF